MAELWIDLVVSKVIHNEVRLIALPVETIGFRPWLDNKALPDVSMVISHLEDAEAMGFEEGRRIIILLKPQDGF